MENVCYISVQNLPSRLLSKNSEINIHKTIILGVALRGCETWYLTLKEEQIEGVRAHGAEYIWWEKYILWNFIICTLHKILLG
jgi:hypothetical protein